MITSTSKKYYWIKLPDDFFQDKAIKKLRKLSGGDTCIIVYLKMLLKSMPDDGYLYYDGIESTFADEIALDIDEGPDDVKVTIAYLLKAKLMEQRSESDIFLNRLPEMVGHDSDVAIRKRRSRAKIADKSATVTGQQRDIDVTSCDNVTRMSQNVTQRREEKIRDKSREELDKSRDREEKNSCSEQSEPAPELADVEPVVLNDGTEWRPDIGLYDEYKKLYPAVDIDEEFRKMRAWCLSNSKKRKTKSGVKRFVNSWLDRAQNSYHPAGSSKSSSYMDAIRNRVDIVDTWT